MRSALLPLNRHGTCITDQRKLGGERGGVGGGGSGIDIDLDHVLGVTC